MANNNIVIFDTETDSLDVVNGKGSVIQYACIALDTDKIEYIPGSEFFTWVLPEDIDDDDYIKNHESTLNWHADLRKISVEDFVKQIKDNGISQKMALEQFSEHVRGYGTPRSQPPAGGQNIKSFDLPIIDVLCEKYKVKPPFSKKSYKHWDLLDVTSKWFPYAEQSPRGLSMDVLRDWYRLEDPEGQSHDALTDVLHEGYFIKRFMNLHKTMIKKIPNLNKRPTEKVVL
jgi:hypothetical protein